MRLFICRHGETTGDIEGRFGGDYDDHLSELGVSQSLELALKLKNKGIEKIYSSPLFRAKETAQAISKVYSLQIDVIPEIKERNSYGVITGMTRDEAESRYPEIIKNLSNFRLTMPGGENYQIFGKRIKKALNKIMSAKYQTVCVITHGGPLRFIFREILKKGEIKITDCGYVELENNRIVNLDGITLV